MHYAQTTSHPAANRVKPFLIEDRREHQLQQSQQLPAYVKLLQQAHPDLYVKLDFESSDSTSSTSSLQMFRRIFIYPIESRSSFSYMRKFMAIDGTFLKARFVQTLFFAVGIDGNGQNLPLA